MTLVKSNKIRARTAAAGTVASATPAQRPLQRRRIAGEDKLSERIAAATVVWCAGMQAHPLTGRFPVERDRLVRGIHPVETQCRKLMKDLLTPGPVRLQAQLVDSSAIEAAACRGRSVGIPLNVSSQTLFGSGTVRTSPGTVENLLGPSE